MDSVLLGARKRMNRNMLVIGTLFTVLGIVNLDISPSHLPILAYPLMAIGLFLVVLSFLIPPHYFQSINGETTKQMQN